MKIEEGKHYYHLYDGYYVKKLLAVMVKFGSVEELCLIDIGVFNDTVRLLKICKFKIYGNDVFVNQHRIFESRREALDKYAEELEAKAKEIRGLT